MEAVWDFFFYYFFYNIFQNHVKVLHWLGSLDLVSISSFVSPLLSGFACSSNYLVVHQLPATHVSHSPLCVSSSISPPLFFQVPCTLHVDLGWWTTRWQQSWLNSLSSRPMQGIERPVISTPSFLLLTGRQDWELVQGFSIPFMGQSSFFF